MNNLDAIKSLRVSNNLLEKYGADHYFVPLAFNTARKYVEEVLKNTATGSDTQGYLHEMAKGIVSLMKSRSPIDKSLIDCFESCNKLLIREEEKKCRSKRIEGKCQGQCNREEEKEKNDEKEKDREEENEERGNHVEKRGVLSIDSSSECEDDDEDGKTKHHVNVHSISPSPKKQKTVEGKTNGGIGQFAVDDKNEDKDDVEEEGSGVGGDDNIHGNVTNEVDPKISRITKNSTLVISYQDQDAAFREIQRIGGSKPPASRINRTGTPGKPFTPCDNLAVILNSVLRRQKNENGLSWSELTELCKSKALEHQGVTAVDTKIKSAFPDRAKTFDPYSNKNKDKPWAPKMRKFLETEYAFLNNE